MDPQPAAPRPENPPLLKSNWVDELGLRPPTGSGYYPSSYVAGMELLPSLRERLGDAGRLVGRREVGVEEGGKGSLGSKQDHEAQEDHIVRISRLALGTEDKAVTSSPEPA